MHRRITQVLLTMNMVAAGELARAPRNLRYPD